MNVAHMNSVSPMIIAIQCTFSRRSKRKETCEESKHQHLCVQSLLRNNTGFVSPLSMTQMFDTLGLSMHTVLRC